MKTLSAAELLLLWETGSKQSNLERALILLEAVYEINDPTIITKLSIGERDALLLQLREFLFGSLLSNKASCPHCSNIVEWDIRTTDLYLQPVVAFPREEIFEFRKDDTVIRYRLPNSNDMLHALSAEQLYLSDPSLLVKDCIIYLENKESPVNKVDLEPALLMELDKQMGLHDPQAEINMMLTCAECSCTWEVAFDIVSYLWSEIDVLAKRLLQEVYLIASVFNWSERDILAMSPKRRQSYIDLIQT